jgi:hypothetical protein
MAVEKWITVETPGREPSAVHRRCDKPTTSAEGAGLWAVAPIMGPYRACQDDTGHSTAIAAESARL